MTNNKNILIIKRTDYKAIKNMNREQLSEYLSRVWKRGFEKGYDRGRKDVNEVHDGTAND